jgi:beta-glucosidase/6-phospho-beta-glucosidase/beta-galactosidase
MDLYNQDKKLIRTSLNMKTEGRFGGVNMAGISYYNKLINALLLKGLLPQIISLSIFCMQQSTL